MNRTTSGEIPCALCGVCDADEVFGPGVAQNARIVRCRRCNLMYASPRAKEPDVVEIAAWGIDPTFDVSVQHPQRWEKERLQVRDYAGTRAMLGRLHPARGKILEVGSSLGFLLQTFRDDGWNVLGIDPDPNGCRHATEQLGIPTVKGTLEDANLGYESVDVVVMLHVIEHLPDPVGTLREIYRVLKPGGHLVLETPRYDTLAFRLLGRRERSVNCDGHIYFFTSSTLRQACEQAGFQLVRCDYVGRSLSMDRLVYNLGVMSKSPALKQRLQSLSRSLGLQNLRLHLNLRDMQRVVVSKTGLIGPADRRQP